MPAKVGGRSADTAAPWSVPLSDVTVRPGAGSCAGRNDPIRLVEFRTPCAGVRAAFARMCGSRTRSRSPTALPRCTCAAGAWLRRRATRCSLPSLNFVAAANTIVHVGATPVFCDIRGEDDLNRRPRRHRRRNHAADQGDHRHALRRTPCRMDAILDIAATARARGYRGRSPCARRALAGRCAGPSATSAASASSRTRTFRR